MHFQPLRSITHALLPRMQRHRLATSLIATGMLVAGLATPYLVQAQCVQTGTNWECSGNIGTTTIDAGSETNTFTFLDGVKGFLKLNGGGGNDTIDFSKFVTAVFLVPTSVIPEGHYQLVAPDLGIHWTGFGDDITIYTGSGDDTVIGGEGNNTIYTGAGNDAIYGRDGNDTIYAGDGNDTIKGGGGTNGIFGEAGNDTITSGSGNDAISGGEGDDTINAGAGDDYVTGGTGADKLYGEDGNDVLNGGKDADTLDGGAGTDERYDKGDSCEQDTVTSIEIDPCVEKEEPEPVVEVKVQAPAPATPDMCLTTGTRMSLNDRNMLSIFSDFGDHNPNGMLITEIPLGAIRAVTDEEKASNAWVPLAFKNSEYAKGWSVGIYWHDNHYGVIVYKDGGQTVVDDTGAVCGWF